MKQPSHYTTAYKKVCIYLLIVVSTILGLNTKSLDPAQLKLPNELNPNKNTQQY